MRSIMSDVCTRNLNSLVLVYEAERGAGRGGAIRPDEFVCPENFVCVRNARKFRAMDFLKLQINITNKIIAEQKDTKCSG